jgi:hypothetical protein
MHAELSPANANVEDRGMEPRRREHRRPLLLRQLCIGRNYNGGGSPAGDGGVSAQPSLPGRAQLDGANPGTRRSIEGEPLRCCRAWLAAQAKIDGQATRHRNLDVVFRFARDSLLEEAGFELSVPLVRATASNRLLSVREHRDRWLIRQRRQAAWRRCRGKMSPATVDGFWRSAASVNDGN